MNAVIISLFALAAVPSVFGGSLYGEKDDAISEIEKKYDELEQFGRSLFQNIEDERAKDYSNFEKQAKDEGQKAAKEALDKLKEVTLETTKTAIAKGKPLTAIECIGKTTFDGKLLIENTSTNYVKTVEGIKKNKIQKLDFEFFEVNLIMTAALELKKQSVTKIEEAKTGITALKADALKKIESAKKQQLDIEEQIPKPVLIDEYSNLRKQIKNKFNEVSDSLAKRLQKCIA